MTQVKLWQIVSQTTNALIFSDADGNLKNLAAGGAQQILVSGPDGAPAWADNSALVSALQAQTDAANALATAKAYTEAQIAALVDNAPIALNTLNELAQKLGSEESAINALLIQVDGKAGKAEVDTLVAQTKQDAMAEARAYTDSATSAMTAGFSSQVSTAKAEVLSQAAGDAGFKAATAKVEAVQDARSYTDQAVANVAADASAKVAGLLSDIPGTFQVEGTSTACFIASSGKLDKDRVVKDGLLVTGDFTEVTGAQVAADDPCLNVKLMFVNGVAQSDEWAARKTAGGQLAITLSDRLAAHVFDGTENSILLLVECRSRNRITRIG